MIVCNNMNNLSSPQKPKGYKGISIPVVAHWGDGVSSSATMKDISGHQYNHLKAIRYSHANSKGRTCWVFECDCGTVVTRVASKVTCGHTQSCGCLVGRLLRARNTVHGCWKTPTYEIWKGMIRRCYHPSHRDYKNYGAKGIGVCVRWKQFSNFLKDMGERPKGLSIDRIDNSGDYCPENCRWATSLQQNHNRRNNVNLTFNGQTMCVSQWARILKIPSNVLYYRLNLRHWEVNRVLTEPYTPRLPAI